MVAGLTTGALREAADDPSCLAPFQRAISVQLVLEEPLPGDGIGMRRSGHERPGAVGLKGVVLRLHSRKPLRITDGSSD